MRKSLKTECKQLSVALVSRIRLSNCFSISCVFDSILWEKSWRNRKSCEEKKRTKKMKTKAKAEHISQTSELLGFLQHFYDCLGKDDDELLFMWPIAELREKNSDLPLSRLPKTSQHCSDASLQESRVSPKSEHLSLSVRSCWGHLLFPPATHSSAIKSLVVTDGINNSEGLLKHIINKS